MQLHLSILIPGMGRIPSFPSGLGVMIEDGWYLSAADDVLKGKSGINDAIFATQILRLRDRAGRGSVDAGGNFSNSLRLKRCGQTARAPPVWPQQPARHGCQLFSRKWTSGIARQSVFLTCTDDGVDEKIEFSGNSWSASGEPVSSDFIRWSHCS